MAAMAVKERLNLSGQAKITVLKELANKAGIEFGPVGSAQHEIDWMGEQQKSTRWQKCLWAEEMQ